MKMLEIISNNKLDSEECSIEVKFPSDHDSRSYFDCIQQTNLIIVYFVIGCDKSEELKKLRKI